MAEDKDLLPGETPLLHINRHPLVLVKEVLVPTLVILAISIVLVLIKFGGTLRDLRWFIVLAMLLGLFVYLDIRYIIWRSVTYTITDQRILQRRGVLGKFTRSIGIARVQDVSTSQSVFGRLFDFGNVEIESAGKDGAEIFTYVPDPEHFRDILFEQLHGPNAPRGAAT
jgi:uncharacterized membrane protein YdbT with pleckstrin-like domain